MQPAIVYVTAGSREEALRIARCAVEARIAACANVFPAITSVYRWDGAIQEDGEVSLILKTREDLIDVLVAKIKEIHSYDCPCVVSFPITGGNPAFLEWIAEETR